MVDHRRLDAGVVVDGNEAEPIAMPLIVVAEDIHAGQRLDRFLAERVDTLSRSRLQSLIRSGAVRCHDDVLLDPKRKVQGSDVFTIEVPPPASAVPTGEAIPLDIVHEDADLIVINKPFGLVVHPSAGHETGTLVNGLIAHCGEELSGIGGVRRPGIVHRLDKDTTGLLVVAKSDAAHQGLSAQFAAHGSDGRLYRAYTALCWGVPMHSSGRIEAPLGRSTINRLKMAVVPEKRGRFAATQFEVLERLGVGVTRKSAAANTSTGSGSAGSSANVGSREILASELRLILETGRTHQIRVHLAHLGNPVIGDPLYALGFKSRARRFEEHVAAQIEGTTRQMLHAGELGFEHPISGEALRFQRPPPEDYCRLKDVLNEV
ncbi:MAG: pseudouridine synthase [Pseudomonadota bacterium]